MPVVIEEELTQRGSGRGVLETSSLVVDAVAGARRGIGITALAAQTGLPKSTVHRIAGQLTESGLLERVGQRYFIGATVGRWGRSHRPARELHQAAMLPSIRLGQLSLGLVGLVIVSGETPETVLTYSTDALPVSVDLTTDAWRATAVGRVLGFGPGGPVRHDIGPALVTEECESVPGVSCVAGELTLPGLGCPAALCTLFFRPTLPAAAPGQLVSAMRAVERNWRMALEDVG